MSLERYCINAYIWTLVNTCIVHVLQGFAQQCDKLSLCFVYVNSIRMLSLWHREALGMPVRATMLLLCQYKH